MFTLKWTFLVIFIIFSICKIKNVKIKMNELQHFAYSFTKTNQHTDVWWLFVAWSPMLNRTTPELSPNIIRERRILGLWRSDGMHSPCWGVMIHNYTSADNALSLTHTHKHAYIYWHIQMCTTISLCSCKKRTACLIVDLFICQWKHIIDWMCNTTSIFYLTGFFHPSRTS